MKKEYLDFLYEQRESVKKAIKKLDEVCKSPRPANREDLELQTKVELKTRRIQLLGINKAIEKYIDIH
ncbi:hypothetical protein [Tenacibaculum sp. 190524A05c]|uniref:hypothetical protein n=1 Tax=Tenacibaculum platacis TaxID=3137852 RepID=UPI0031FAEF14